MFLGEIVTTLELPPDAPLRKSCGACARCVDACPTQALRGDYTIDANRCISDLTQRTDAIPATMRPLIGDWVWGCDLCQLVCPPTAVGAEYGVVASGRRATSRPRGRRWSSCCACAAAISSGAIKSTAMGWRGAAVLRRNAAVALGNALDRSAVGALVESMRVDPHPMVRGHAAWALGRIGSPVALAALRRQQGVEGDAAVREEIRSALEPFTTR